MVVIVEPEPQGLLELEPGPRVCPNQEPLVLEAVRPELRILPEQVRRQTDLEVRLRSQGADQELLECQRLVGRRKLVGHRQGLQNLVRLRLLRSQVALQLVLRSSEVVEHRIRCQQALRQRLAPVAG